MASNSVNSCIENNPGADKLLYDKEGRDGAIKILQYLLFKNIFHYNYNSVRKEQFVKDSRCLHTNEVPALKGIQ